MNPRTYHRLQAFLLIGWGLFLLDKIFSAKILFYINRRYVVLILLTALAFLALAQIVLGARRRVPGERQANDVLDSHAHRHDGAEMHKPSAWGLAVLTAPLILGLLVPAQPLGSSVAANRGVNLSASLQRLQNSPTSGTAPGERTVLDWVNEFNRTGSQSALNGQPVDVIGFVYHDPRLGKDQFLVSRFVVTCCVADALALGMVVDTPGAASLGDNTWVSVQGKIQAVKIASEVYPGITASQVKPIAMPDQPYLFP